MLQISTSRLRGRFYLPQTVPERLLVASFVPSCLFFIPNRGVTLSISSTGLIGRIHTDGSLRQASEVNSYRSEVEHHIDVQPRTRSLLSMLYHLLDFCAAILSSLRHRPGLVFFPIPQITSRLPYPLH